MHDVEKQLKQFLQQSAYMTQGAIVTDLDGTVLQEEEGKARIAVPVEAALNELYGLGRPVILNTLRFPLNVIRTLGQEWHRLAREQPIPLVSMNGSQIGFVKASDHKGLVFEELAAFPLAPSEIEEILAGVDGLLAGGIRDLLVFSYPRDWRIGEVIWTPVAEAVPFIRGKYKSASSVIAVELGKLRQRLLDDEICMMFLLINIAEDKLMAYQHTKPSSFFTHANIDKLSGALQLTMRLGVDLAHSVGAGDTEMDRFLKGVGLALQVGEGALEYHGLSQTIRVKHVLELGEILFRLAELQKTLMK